MTNAMIIENARIELMKSGIINGTGRMIKVITSQGQEIEIEEPEEIHTYQAWKSLGYQVMKGEKAKAKIKVWKYTTRKVEVKGKDTYTGETVTTEEKENRMIMTTASFFTMSQVERI